MISKPYTEDLYDPERRKRYLENYERIFGKKNGLRERSHREVGRKKIKKHNKVG